MKLSIEVDIGRNNNVGLENKDVTLTHCIDIAFRDSKALKTK